MRGARQRGQEALPEQIRYDLILADQIGISVAELVSCLVRLVDSSISTLGKKSYNILKETLFRFFPEHLDYFIVHPFPGFLYLLVLITRGKKV